ncbi:sensor histidine kinase [Paenibacillus filicis]|uniref:Sensor histidine kinase n=1 Tax=Paenibacillus filicis TaxID=669464 RepID=A0ABU9DSX3_9BACL
MNLSFIPVWKRKHSIKTAFMLHFFVIIFILLIAILYASYVFFSNYFIEQSRITSLTITKEVMANIDYYFNEVQETLLDASVSSSIQVGVRGTSGTSGTATGMKFYLDNIREVQRYLNDLTAFKPDIDDIIITKMDGKSFDSAKKSVRPTYAFDQAEWFPELTAMKSQSIFVGPHKQDYYYDSDAVNTLTVSAIAPIRDIYMNHNNIGAIIVNLNMSKISAILERLEISPGYHVYLLDNHQQLVFSNSNTAPASFLEAFSPSGESGYYMEGTGTNHTLYVYAQSKINNWSIVLGVPIAEVTKKIREFRLIIILLFLLILPMVWLIAYVISNRITSPIKKLMSRMTSIEKWIGQGTWKVEPLNQSYVEIDVLSSRFDLMVHRINDLINQAYRLELEQKDSQLRALQARINPHFLYNTLQTIKSLAMLGNTSDISRLVTLLGHQFRYTIGKEDYMVTVEDEISHLKHYLEIQIKWLRTPCEYEIHIDDRLLACQIPRLSIQPIVENCFAHAFAGLKRSGSIRITGYIRDKQAILEIWDNGTGISNAALAELRANLDTLANDQGDHIALLNVQRRFVLKFGQAYGLSVESQEGSWTRVRLALPILQS